MERPKRVISRTGSMGFFWARNHPAAGWSSVVVHLNPWRPADALPTDSLRPGRLLLPPDEPDCGRTVRWPPDQRPSPEVPHRHVAAGYHEAGMSMRALRQHAASVLEEREGKSTQPLPGKDQGEGWIMLNGNKGRNGGRGQRKVSCHSGYSWLRLRLLRRRAIPRLPQDTTSPRLVTTARRGPCQSAVPKGQEPSRRHFTRESCLYSRHSVSEAG
jgi:hypothetical protein